MKRKYIFILFLIAVLPYVGAEVTLVDTRKQLVSPDGNYLFTFYQKQFPDEHKQMYYTLSYKGKN
jgi:alpha-glucosidase